MGNITTRLLNEQLLAKQLFNVDLNDLVSFLEEILNHAMWLQRQKHMNALPFERTPHRRAYGNGYKPKKWKSPIGTLNLKVPKSSNHDEPFYPALLERGERSNRAVCLLMAKMYVNGVATRKVAEVRKELGLENMSASKVSRVTRQSRVFFSRMTILAMFFKLVMVAQKNWRRMKGCGLLPQVELGMEFKDAFPFIPNMPPTIAVEPASSTIHDF